MQSNFNKAALSYFGLAETRAELGDVVSDQGEIGLVIRLPLTDEDVMGIADRMKAMREHAPHEPLYAETQMPSREELRDQYNALSHIARSRYGSFHRYCVAVGAGDPYEVQSKVELPAHVYLSHAEATEQQKVMAIGRGERGNYAVAVEDLTEEQRAMRAGTAADDLRAAYVQRTMAAHERLNGADGKPTSNADDFGGLPG